MLVLNMKSLPCRFLNLVSGHNVVVRNKRNKLMLTKVMGLVKEPTIKYSKTKKV